MNDNDRSVSLDWKGIKASLKSITVDQFYISPEVFQIFSEILVRVQFKKLCFTDPILKIWYLKDAIRINQNTLAGIGWPPWRFW